MTCALQYTFSPLEATRVQKQDKGKFTRNLWKSTSIHWERAHGADGARNFYTITDEEINNNFKK